MFGFRRCFRLIVAADILCLLITLPADAAQRRSKRKPAARQKPVAQEIVPEQPATPPIQLTLAQKPAVPPRVEYQNGQLAIVAENSTLGDILRAVRQQTGAAIDIPANASERVVTRLGPASAHDVLTALLNGSSFNYVMLGSPTDPSAVNRLIVTAKPAGGEVPVAGNFQPPQPGARPGVAYTPPPQPMPANQASEEDAEPAPEETSEEQSPSEQPEEQSEDQLQQQPGNQPVVKTPEQLLQELQRQQQLQQQQQQQAPQAAPQGFPIPPGAPQQPPDQNAAPQE